MACCGLCRPKSKQKIKNPTNKNLTKSKLNVIDMWIEHIEGPPYESIPLPSQPPHKPIQITNAEEIEPTQHSIEIPDEQTQ